MGYPTSNFAGHSIGEYAAACVANIFSLKDALWLVSERGRLMQSMQPGDMLSVYLPEKAIQSYLNESISIAAINGEQLTVVAGESTAIKALSLNLEKNNVKNKLLNTSHAFHSHMMEPMLAEFEDVLSKVTLNEPCIPIVSTVTAQRLTNAEAISHEYWIRQIRKPVRFAHAIKNLWQDESTVCLELGPRTSATTLARQQITDLSKQAAFPCLGNVSKNLSEANHMQFALGELWSRDVTIDWKQCSMAAQANKISLPTYAFNQKEYRLDQQSQTIIEQEQDVLVTKDNVVDYIVNLLTQITDYQGKAVNEVNFIAAGIDSLGLTQFSLSLQKKYKVTVSMMQVLTEYSTPLSLAEYIYSGLTKSNEVNSEGREIEGQDLISGMRVNGLRPKHLKIGVDEQGNPGWFDPKPGSHGQYKQLEQN